jgi:hypothetical protein
MCAIRPQTKADHIVALKGDFRAQVTPKSIEVNAQATDSTIKGGKPESEPNQRGRVLQYDQSASAR